MTKTRLTFLVLVAALVGGLFGTADAASSSDPRTKRDELRNERAAQARQLDGIKAGERELIAAVGVLNQQVAAQTARVEAARQAVAAAEGELAEAETSLAQTRGRITGLTDTLIARAVQSFIRPDTSEIDEVVQSSDIAETARRKVLMGSVAASDADVIDQLNAAREDFELAKAAAEAARAKAVGRRTVTETELGTLETARVEQRRLQANLETRKREVLGEIEALSRDEARLSREIADRQAALARQEQARRQSEATTRNVSTAPAGSGGCVWPTRGAVTSEYGNRWGRLHAGIDIGASTGTPIWASKAGTVISSGRQGAYGNTVVLSHAGNMTTLYAHQSRIVVSNGQTVRQGEVIGYVGNTGSSTGPHLHFETRYGGSPRNPRSCLS
ncbi:MAG TPA: peptidoglycan DD-metalloendopeptidase family protein [Acidimicrobiales bacterium]|nr:peptidoglycan DD-metalloendopeptidase family protein [Acidimicrobiales bacterium]